MSHEPPTRGRDAQAHPDITPGLIAERILLSALREQDRAIAIDTARASAELLAAEAGTRLEHMQRRHQSQRLDAIGTLAGGVAHDFNNLLTVIGIHSAFLLDALGEEHPYHGDAEAIQAAGVSAAVLTSQLLAFSRRQILRPVDLDLNHAIAGARVLIENLLGARIALTVELAPDIAHVTADPTQVAAVINNLAVNARDAMRGAGTLLIQSRDTYLAEPACVGSDMMPAGAWVTLMLRDDGRGMTERVKERLFEPFFTTKEFGSGTGLGLATTYGIVRQSGGYINVESAPGQGSTFEVHLPAAPRATRAGPSGGS
ncbi:MAG: hybrid sensor histidine kinase/response regulator [Gemmatimonadetes bacterium]|nr:hybrid sensor histidine kinase/response regulator [Gemmatimonadota bacterium]